MKIIVKALKRHKALKWFWVAGKTNSLINNGYDA